MRVTNKLNTIILLVAALGLFNNCSNLKKQGDRVQEVGYFMQDGTGMYFLTIPNATGNVKNDLNNNPEVTAIKLVDPYDSLEKLKLPSDTLINLQDSLQNVSRNYALVIFIPVNMEYTVIDTLKYVPPELQHAISFPFEFSGGKTTITYTCHYIQIKKLSPLNKR